LSSCIGLPLGSEWHWLELPRERLELTPMTFLSAPESLLLSPLMANRTTTKLANGLC
jgi:hypothetical protein